MTDGKRGQNQVFQGGNPPPGQPQPQQQPDGNPPPVGIPNMPAEHRAIDDLGYEIPVDLVPLPSRGLVYGTNSTLHGREGVEIRAMTARDEDILTSRALIKKGTVISHLLRSCMNDKSINPNDLLLADRNALMVALRITGYGADYAVEVSCPQCNEKEQNEFDLQELPIKWLELTPDAPGENLFSMDLPVSKKRIQFRFLTGRDEEELSRDAEQRKKKLKTSFDNLITSQLARLIVSVDGKQERMYISKFIANMSVRDSRVLRKYIEDHQPGIDMQSNFTCGNCGESSEVEVPIGTTFFWPDA